MKTIVNHQKANRSSIMKSLSITQTSLAGKQLLLTGTTGYLGKVILEKLIRSVPDLGGITLLIRGNNKYPDATIRFHQQVVSSSIFDYLRQENPEVLQQFLRQKITCVNGDVTQNNLGLDAEIYDSLIKSVDVIVNSAASLNFLEGFDTALRANTYALHNLAQLAEDADVPFIQISTCFVNGRNSGIINEDQGTSATEKIPLSEDGYHDIQPLLDRFDGLIHDIKKKIEDPYAQEKALIELGLTEAQYYGWDETYSFTKWMGEQTLLKRLRGKSLTIVRPSIVESCLQEPVPGWIEGVKVADAIIKAYARNKIFLCPGRMAGILDIIPADLVANAVMLCTGEALRDSPSGRKSRIYQICSGMRNPMTLRNFIGMISSELKQNWYKYNSICGGVAPKHNFYVVHKSVFPLVIHALRVAIAVRDALCNSMNDQKAGTKSRDLEAIEKTLMLTDVYGSKLSPDYVFRNERLMELSKICGDQDRILFPVDPMIIKWSHYCQVHVSGLDRYGMEGRSEKPTVSSTMASELVTPDASGCINAVIQQFDSYYPHIMLFIELILMMGSINKQN